MALSVRNRTGRTLILALAGLVLSGCDSIGYYGQAARGQLDILLSRRSITEVLGDPALSAQRRAQLTTVMALRDFAATALALPVGDSYSTLVELDREHVVWNVFAAPEFSLDPLTWCYPLAGCVSYRGYFTQAAAERYADRLRAEGYDVHLGGVDAYSTLGWFEDPVLSSMLRRGDAQLAGVLFHELAHRRVYVPGDTVFNESFATVVEREGVRRWLQDQGNPDGVDAATVSAARAEAFVSLVMAFQARFRTLYDSHDDVETLRAGKAALQAELRAAYGDLKASWAGYGGYDAWFAGPLNNAQLGSVAAYHDLVPDLEALLRAHDHDLERFYAAVEELGTLDQDARRTALTAVARTHPPVPVTATGEARTVPGSGAEL